LRRWGTRRAGRAHALLACTVTALALGGCGAGDDNPGPGEVTVGEARALDEAAEVLDERRLPDEPLPAAGNTTEKPSRRNENE